MTWKNPWALCLLVFVLPIWWRWLDHRWHLAVRFSSVEWLKRQSRSMRATGQVAIPLIRTLTLGLLVVCLDRPQRLHQETKVVSEGIAIQMLVDRSSSMQAMDFTLEGRPADRLAAVKKVFKEFVQGGGDLDGRPNDLVGMIAFAGYADSRCPLTLDHTFLIEALDRTEIVLPERRREEDGTAIGDAIALAVERLEDLERRRGLPAASKIKTRIVILLTDGENTAGDLSPEKAAKLAAACGIRIFTIGMGTTGVAPMPVRDPSGSATMQPMRVTIDEATLRHIAEVTGGRYWRATVTESMRAICSQIDKLEKTKIEEKQYFQYAEAATETVPIGRLTMPPLLSIVAGLLALEVLLVNTRLRKVP